MATIAEQGPAPGARVGDQPGDQAGVTPADEESLITIPAALGG